MGLQSENSKFRFQILGRTSFLLRLIIGAVLLCPTVVAHAGAGTAHSSSPVSVSSRSIPQGGLLLFSVRVEDKERPRARWMGREVQMVQGASPGEWYGFVGADLKTAAKAYSLKMWPGASARERSVEISVREKDYGERRLTLPKEMVELDPPTLERVKAEAAVMKAALEVAPGIPLWRGDFLKPCEGEVGGAFGRRSIINGQVRSPHSGVDLKAAQGTPVKAMNQGRVVLTCDHFFTGLSVVVDHGGGIQSLYFHLEKISVKEKQQVEKGQVVGYVGSTGRSTGPHLHLSVRVNGARVDPLLLIQLSEGLK